MDSKYYSRKFIITLLLIALGTTGLFLSRISFNEYKDFITYIVGFYFGANVVSGIAGAIMNKDSSDKEAA